MSVLILASVAAGAAVAAPSIDIREVWRADAPRFAEAMQAGAGFSFRYGGNLVGPELGDGWQQSIVEDADAGSTEIHLTHASGLVVTREMRLLANAGAVEYRLRFKNVSSRTVSPLSAIHALNITLGAPWVDGSCVISSGGGLADGFLPPRSFAVRKSCFAPMVRDYGTVELAAEGGRSSNRDLPFFFLQNDALREGLFVAVGWSGQWDAIAQRDPAAETLTLRARIPELDIALEPGEEIRGPTVLVGFYRGDQADGSNRLRRLIRDAYAPKLAGKRFLPIATYDNWWHSGDNFDEALLKRLAADAAEIHQEYFLVDAGWFAPGSRQGYSAGLGNWDAVDNRKLPNGLAPVADSVRARGLKFGLWFEPERVARDTTLAKEHPDWILWKRASTPEAWWSESWMRDILPEAAGLGSAQNYGLLDYGRPEVREWVRNLLDRYIRSYGIKYIRYDFNMDPLPFWDAHDAPHRRGITQLRHIEGFYSIIDWIRERHPDTVLEGCASGGRRIDLETARRFHTFWLSDYTVDPAIVRFHLFGINQFLPGNYHYVQYTLPAPHQKSLQPDDLGFQSLFGGALGTGGRIELWPQEMKERVRRHVAVHKTLRRYLLEDYYPLTPQPGDLESWSAWQFHDPVDHSGFIQTFRTRTADAMRRFTMRGLDARARYRFTDAYSGETFEVIGSEAMGPGVRVEQAPMSSRVFIYQSLSPLASAATLLPFATSERIAPGEWSARPETR
jgi:alpha-galactosidase